jgi:hypothetical protein
MPLKDKIQRKHYEQNWRRKNPKRVLQLGRDYHKRKPWLSHYQAAQQRCQNPKAISFKNYGNLGVKFLLSLVDVEYLWFRDKAYLMKQPSIDRKENALNYTLDNCRFIELKANIAERNNRYKKIILQFNKDGYLIKQWQSISEAANYLKLSACNISTCCHGRLKTTGGFNWRFK